MGLAVSIKKVEEVTRHIGCGILNTLFSFLGSKVGGCVSQIKSWDEVIDKMVNRLSKWKMKTLSIGGRLTLLKTVFGSMPIYHMFICKVPIWNKVLTSKEKEGLGVSSLFALNRALMFKWVWRFFNQRDSLWVRVIHAIHGVDGRIGRAGNVRYTSIWCDIIKEMDKLASHRIDLIRLSTVRKSDRTEDRFGPKVLTEVRTEMFGPDPGQSRLVQVCKVVVCSGIERGFLSQKGSGGGRGVKEKSVNVSHIEAVKEKDLNDEHVATKVQSPFVDHTNAVKTCRGSYPSLPTQGPTPVGNTPGNGIDVVVPVESIRAINESSTDGLNFMFENGLWFICNHPLIIRKWNPDIDLLKKDVGNVPVWVKLYGVPITAFSKDGLSAIVTKLGTPLMLDSYTYDICLQSWGRCSCCKVFGHTLEECPKNIGLSVAKNLKKHSQTSRGVSVDPKVGFKLHKEYRLVLKKPTTSPSGNKKQKGVAHTNEVSNSNLFDILNSVDNDVDFAGNPLKKVKCSGDYDSEDEVASDDKDMARSLASERVGFDTQSLLEQ
nr:RNA-directed DNA polymerase, eukaryota, reverse transcriptase zinc-binding domain protein [Tanacetum cinerariifolium]